MIVFLVAFLLWLISHGVGVAAYILAGMMAVGWFARRMRLMTRGTRR